MKDLYFLVVLVAIVSLVVFGYLLYRYIKIREGDVYNLKRDSSPVINTSLEYDVNQEVCNEEVITEYEKIIDGLNDSNEDQIISSLAEGTLGFENSDENLKSEPEKNPDNYNEEVFMDFEELRNMLIEEFKVLCETLIKNSEIINSKLEENATNLNDELNDVVSNTIKTLKKDALSVNNELKKDFDDFKKSLKIRKSEFIDDLLMKTSD